MAVSLFTTLEKEFTTTGFEKRSVQARAWFTQRVKELNGKIIFSLGAGKAVKVVENIDQTQYKISFKNVNGSTGFAKIGSNRLDFINGEKWYKVKTSSGIVGWVFGKYVQEYYAD